MLAQRKSRVSAGLRPPPSPAPATSALFSIDSSQSLYNPCNHPAERAGETFFFLTLIPIDPILLRYLSLHETAQCAEPSEARDREWGATPTVVGHAGLPGRAVQLSHTAALGTEPVSHVPPCAQQFFPQSIPGRLAASGRDMSKVFCLVDVISNKTVLDQRWRARVQVQSLGSYSISHAALQSTRLNHGVLWSDWRAGGRDGSDGEARGHRLNGTGVDRLPRCGKNLSA